MFSKQKEIKRQQELCVFSGKETKDKATAPHSYVPLVMDRFRFLKSYDSGSLPDAEGCDPKSLEEAVFAALAVGGRGFFIGGPSLEMFFCCFGDVLFFLLLLLFIGGPSVQDQLTKKDGGFGGGTGGLKKPLTPIWGKGWLHSLQSGGSTPKRMGLRNRGSGDSKATHSLWGGQQCGGTTPQKGCLFHFFSTGGLAVFSV